MALHSLNKELVENISQSALPSDQDMNAGLESRSGGMWTPLSEGIQLAACRTNELLHMHPDLPADIFTCCLTTPIEISPFP